MKTKLYMVLSVIILLIITIAPNPGVAVAGSMQSSPNDHTTLPVSAGPGLQPLAGLLNPDGSLDLTTGFKGSLDPNGYTINYAAGSHDSRRKPHYRLPVVGKY